MGPEGPATIVHAVGARPNFVKMASVIAALEERSVFKQLVVHTGQHYDARLSDDILADLDFPRPDRFLGVGSGSHGHQTAKVLAAFEEILVEVPAGRPRRRGGRQLDAGLRAGGREARHPGRARRGGPALARLEHARGDQPGRSPIACRTSCSPTAPRALENLQSEGIEPSRVHYVGNTMIDSLRRCQKRAQAREAWRAAGCASASTCSRPCTGRRNVDDADRLGRIVDALDGPRRALPRRLPGPPAHARAAGGRAGGSSASRRAGVRCIEPLGYLDFLSLQMRRGAIITDSGGVQEEASALGVELLHVPARTRSGRSR